MVEIECKKCEELTTDYTAKDVNGWCRSCRREANQGKNDSQNELCRKYFPTPHNVGVYAIKEGKQFIYIGSADRIPWRLYQHFVCNNSFNDGLNKLQRKLRYSWYILWHGESLEDARHQERLNIQLHQPKFNKILYKNYEA